MTTSEDLLAGIDPALLRTCAICHDQCQFATAELLASGKQTYATSRKALIIDHVRRGRAEWTPAAVAAVYSALNSGVQHEFCVHHGDPEGWPDETDYVRAARAAIARSGRAPDYVADAKRFWEDTGNPYGLAEPDAPGEAAPAGAGVFYVDAATRARLPEQMGRFRAVAAAAPDAVTVLAAGTSGFELYDLGLKEEALRALERLWERVKDAAYILSDSPEAVWMLNAGTAELDGPVFPKAVHHSSWLDDLAQGEGGVPLAPTAQGETLRGKAATFQDPVCLGRYGGGVYEPSRRLAADILGCDLREMRYARRFAMPTGPYLGYPSEELAREIAALRIEQAKAVGAEVFLTASPHDFYNLQRVQDDALEVLYLPGLVGAASGA